MFALRGQLGLHGGNASAALLGDVSSWLECALSCVLHVQGEHKVVRYVPGESDSHMFGGNSNWRGPVWFPITYLLIEALERYHHFYGDDLTVELPTGSGNRVTLLEA